MGQARFILTTPDCKGRLQRGWDTLFLRSVAIRKLPAGLSMHGGGARLLAAWEVWQQAAHPTLLRPGTLDLQEEHLVREWVNGFSLMDMLRHRQRVVGAEAVALLGAAAPAMDAEGAEAFLPTLGTDKWLVAFDEASQEGSASPWLDQPMSGWPAWSLRLDPLRLHELVRPGQDGTRVAERAFRPGVKPAVALACRLVRELLGGAKQRADSPLPGLTEEGNRSLAAAERPGGFASAVELAEVLRETVPAHARMKIPTHLGSMMSWAASPGSSGKVAAGTCLALRPASDLARPLVLLAMPEVRLGRSATEAEIVLRLNDRSATGLSRLQGLSRVHARLRCTGTEVRLFDGGPAGPSGRGTFLRAGALQDPNGWPLHGPMVTQFGGEWRGVIRPVPCSTETALLPWSEEGCPTPDSHWGAVFFQPARGCRLRRETVWLLREAGFGLNAAGALVWDTEALGTAPAAFYRHAGGFFLLNRRLAAAELSIDSVPVPPGTAAPLATGQRLSAGPSCWEVQAD